MSNIKQKGAFCMQVFYFILNMYIKIQKFDKNTPKTGHKLFDIFSR